MPLLTVGKENSNDIQIYYEDHGLGKPVVLIHGFPLSGAAWERQVSFLLEAGFRTITYDRRGFGRSSQPTIGYDYDTFAADLDAVLTSLDLHDVTLVGHSMGTGEIVRYLSTYGAVRVVKAVFVAPIPPFLLKTDDNPEGIEQKVFDHIMQSVTEDRLVYLSAFLSDFFNLDKTLGKSVSEEVVRFNWNIASNASPIGTLACVLTWLTDFRKDISKIVVPSLIIHGDADRILPFEATGKRMHAAVPGSQLVVISDGSHGISWTHAKEVNRALLDFLKE